MFRNIVYGGQRVAGGFTKAVAQRGFSSTAHASVYIGPTPLILPKDVELSVFPLPERKVKRKGQRELVISQVVQVKGPLGSLMMEVPDFVEFVPSENRKYVVTVEKPKDKLQKSMWGTVRTITHNNIMGVSAGHLCIIKLVGTGYRCTIETKDGVEHVGLKVGYCDMKYLPVPKGVKASSPAPNKLVLEGIDKQQVKLFAGTIRDIRPPEPYKGKVSNLGSY